MYSQLLQFLSVMTNRNPLLPGAKEPLLGQESRSCGRQKGEKRSSIMVLIHVLRKANSHILTKIWSGLRHEQRFINTRIYTVCVHTYIETIQHATHTHTDSQIHAYTLYMYTHIYRDTPTCKHTHKHTEVYSLTDSYKHRENIKLHTRTHHTTNRHSLTNAHKYIHSLKTRVWK